jgi:hypothetical protein
MFCAQQFVKTESDNDERPDSPGGADIDNIDIVEEKQRANEEQQEPHDDLPVLFKPALCSHEKPPLNVRQLRYRGKVQMLHVFR